MPEVPSQNVTREPRALHLEVMNVQTGDVWLCQAPITLEAVKALRVEAPFIKSGCTAGSFDAAHFTRSPGAGSDGALDTCVIDGVTFARVARALRFGGLKPDRPTLVSVEKHHVVTFAAGSEVALARLPDGQLYVQQTEPVPGRAFTPPADWQLETRRLQAPWTVQVPPPVSVYFFASLCSFMGPVDGPVGGA
jgi:hypothetical protein